MGTLIRAYDWANSPLGAPDCWPQPLKTSVRLLLSSGHPMFIWWGSELIQFYNDAYRKSIGPERHPNAIGQKGRECWEEIWEVIAPQIDLVMSKGGSTWNENHLVPITRNGKRENVYWTYSYSPIDDPTAENGVGGVLVICSETTEHILAKQHAKAAEERWRELFRQVRGFICILKGPEHRFEYANPPYYAVVNQNESIVGKTVAEVMPEVVDQGLIKLLDQVYNTGETYHADAFPVEFRKSPDEPIRTVYVSFAYQAIRDSDGEITGVLVDGYDVTDRVKATESLLEEDRRKDEFLAMLAHELRNPLAPIRNASELLNQIKSHHPQLKMIGEMLGRQVNQLTDIVDDLLDISRITQGRIVLQTQPIEINSIIDSVIETANSAIQQKQHTVSYQRAEEDIYVNGDMTRIIQCVSNVLNNAIKYTSPGGHIDIAVQKSNETVQIAITDNGPGLSKEMLPKVFDLFSQEKQTLDRSQGGLGIGLAIVKRMLKMHGGTCVAHSDGLDCGATFTISLPMIAAPKNAVVADTSDSSASKRVLLVDDNKDSADSLSQLLSMLGHTTETIYSGKETFDAVSTFSPEVVLLDIGLPDINGYEIARSLSQTNPSIQLIAITGYGQQEDIDRAKEAGFDLHFTKPVALADIRRVLSL